MTRLLFRWIAWALVAIPVAAVIAALAWFFFALIFNVTDSTFTDMWRATYIGVVALNAARYAVLYVRMRAWAHKKQVSFGLILEGVLKYALHKYEGFEVWDRKDFVFQLASSRNAYSEFSDSLLNATPRIRPRR